MKELMYLHVSIVFADALELAGPGVSANASLDKYDQFAIFNSGNTGLNLLNSYRNVAVLFNISYKTAI